MLTLTALSLGLLTRFAPLSTPLTRCGVPCMLYDRGQDSGAEVDVAKVQSLLSRRAELRRAGDYSGADAVRAELKDLDVTVWDRDRVWMHGTGDTQPPTNSYDREERRPQRGEGANEPRKERSGRSHAAAFGNRIFVENLNLDTDWGALKDHFKDAGYPVAYASVSYDKEAQRSKGQGIVQFETADAMEHALSEAGMTGTTLDGQAINCRPDAKAQHVAARARDSRRFDGYGDQGRDEGGESWGGDAGRGGDGARGGGRAAREYNEFGHDYSRNDDDRTTLDSATSEKIHRLLWQRLEAKLSRDFGKADELLAELGELGVSVADRQRQWRVDGASFARAYTRVARDARSCPGGQVDTARVARLLEERPSASNPNIFILQSWINQLTVDVDNQGCSSPRNGLVINKISPSQIPPRCSGKISRPRISPG